MFSRWQEDNAARLAAALSFYTIFSLSPLLTLVIAVVSLAWDPAAVESQILGQVDLLLGADLVHGRGVYRGICEALRLSNHEFGRSVESRDWSQPRKKSSLSVDRSTGRFFLRSAADAPYGISGSAANDA